MTTYSIKDLERLSGIKAHTVRIWEQRYNLLTPNRSDTNIRSYSDEEVKKLLNVSTLVHAGLKISKISKMSKDDITQELDSIYQQQIEGENQFYPQINVLIAASLNYDRGTITNILSEVIENYGFEIAFEKMLYPVLRRVGQLWRKDKLSPSQEHFLSGLIKQKLYSQIENLGHNNSDKKSFVLFLPEWEDHEIGLLYGHYLLRKIGFNVTYLGSKVPARNLVDTANTLKPDYVLTFMIGSTFKDAINKYFQVLSENCSSFVLISGNQNLIRNIEADLKIKSFATIEEFKDFVNFI